MAEKISWERVSKGYERPVDLIALPSMNGEADHFLVLEQEGKLILTDFQDLRKKVLDWSDKVTRKGNEQGFLSVTLSPDFKSSGKAYFNLNNKKGDTEIWRCIFDVRDLSKTKKKPELLLSFKQPFKNHNGGWTGFGPDGMLYIATGDGGSSNDPKNAAQDLTSLLGKLLRIDVSSEHGYEIPRENPYLSNPDAKNEIFSYGLRNPWRCHWDKNTLIIADVGQNHREEINAVSLKALKGANFGWRLREGDVQTPNKKVGGAEPKEAIKPFLVYPHDGGKELGGFSITGGVVYNGSVSSLAGRYFFADYNLPRVWSVKIKDENSYEDLQTHTETILPNKGKLQSISSFSVDNNGELYVLSLMGNIFKLVEKG